MLSRAEDGAGKVAVSMDPALKSEFWVPHRCPDILRARVRKRELVRSSRISKLQGRQACLASWNGFG